MGRAPIPLRRSDDDKLVAGVIGGLAEYFDLDPTLLRAIYVVLSLVSVAFPGLILYVALWIVIPRRL